MIVLLECIISTISLIMLKALYSVVCSVKVACYNYGRRLLAGGEIQVCRRLVLKEKMQIYGNIWVSAM